MPLSTTLCVNLTMPHLVPSDASLKPEVEGVLPDGLAESEEATEHQLHGEGTEREIEKIKQEVKLEDLFNDDDDDEFSSSSSTLGSKMEVDSSPAKAPEYVKFFHRHISASFLRLNRQAVKFSDPETMYAFYQRLFPFRCLFQWLNHGVKPAPDFGHREFAFTLQNDGYLRYQSFPTADLYVLSTWICL